MRDVTENPYQAPAVQEVVAPASNEAEAIRSQHLKHEASLKAVGFLYLLSAVFVFVAFAGIFVPSMLGASQGSVQPSMLDGAEMMIFGLLAAVGVGQLITGWGLRKLRPWVKIPAALLAGISLISFPVGTLIGGYALYLLFSAKGGTILSPGYADIVAQTPHLRYRTPIWMWIVLLVVVLVVLGLAIFSTGAG